MDTILLRKLTEKSIINFGQFDGWTVGKILDMQKTGYLRWIYYNYEGLTFTDEILEKMRVNLEDRIKKPGKNPELHEITTNEKRGALYNANFLAYMKEKSHLLKGRKIKMIRDQSMRKAYNRKDILQAKNQGH